MTKVVEGVIEVCNPCQLAAPPTSKQTTSLRVIERGGPFKKWGMDFVGPLPRTAGGYQYLVTAIDYGTAWACAIPLKKQSAKAAIEMVKSIILQFGVPEEITTDNGPEFDSYKFINFLKINLIQHNRTSPYHPQSNGLVERFHQTLISAVRKLVSPNSQDKWDEVLEQALFGYRVSKNGTLGKSPYFLVHGIEPRLPHNPCFFGPVPPITSQEAELLYRKHNIDSKELNIARQKAIETANEKAQ
jgi:transposase InsO family protein